jgi:hypothetical protein
MKHLKKFNEELKPSTYRRAASKLKKMGGFNVDSFLSFMNLNLNIVSVNGTISRVC